MNIDFGIIIPTYKSKDAFSLRKNDEQMTYNVVRHVDLARGETAGIPYSIHQVKDANAPLTTSCKRRSPAILHSI